MSKCYSWRLLKQINACTHTYAHTHMQVPFRKGESYLFYKDFTKSYNNKVLGYKAVLALRKILLWDQINKTLSEPLFWNYKEKSKPHTKLHTEAMLFISTSLYPRSCY